MQIPVSTAINVLTSGLISGISGKGLLDDGRGVGEYGTILEHFSNTVLKVQTAALFWCLDVAKRLSYLDLK